MSDVHTLGIPRHAEAPGECGADPLETKLNRGFAFLLGLLLPVLTLRTGYVGTPRDLFSRIAPVDVLCAVFLALLAARHRLRSIPIPGMLYLFAIVISLVPGLGVTPGPELEVWWQLSAALMAFAFYVLGLTLGSSAALVRCVLAGTCLAVMAETAIVYHDYFSPAQWFPDPMPGRARGTFKANGQLGAYGWCAAGLLATFGATFASPRHRGVLLLAALAAATFPFPASRRTGMVCVVLWAAVFLILGLRFRNRRFYRVLAAGFLAAFLCLAICRGALSESFLGKRLAEAVEGSKRPDSFIGLQHRNALETLPRWFPFGFGVGRGSRIDPRDGHEVHNGLLAVLVEQGVLGLAGFASMALAPMFGGAWRKTSEEHALLSFLLTSFLLVSLVFMIHNTLYRDRTFLLYLGLVAAAVRNARAQGEATP